MTEITTTQEFIEAFVKGELGNKRKQGSTWSVLDWGNGQVLQYTPSDLPDTVEMVAFKMEDGSVLSNANRLEYVGRKFAWGHERSHRWGQTEEPEQVWLRNAGAVPIPFTLFTEMKADVRDFTWVVKPVAEDVIVLRPPRHYGDQPHKERRHFSGACLFTIDKEMFLFDIDRQELEHNIFNPFVTKLPKHVKSIQEAYEVLMPDEVKKAIADEIEVQRQGEFFFIKVSDECPVKVELTDEEKNVLRHPPSRFGYGLTTPADNGRLRWVDDETKPYDKGEKLDTPEKREFQKDALRYKKVRDKYIEVTSRPGTLGKSSTGSHNVEKYIKDGEIVYASGTIKQNRREHADLVLKGWYKVIANTGTISWTITGDID